MMGHGETDSTRYPRAGIHQNVSALSPELLRKVNQLVVHLGHRTVGRNEEAPLKCRSDSKPVKTNVHVPTDLRLLQDATRCLIRVRANLARTLERSRWRPHKSLREKLRKKYPSSRKGRSSEYKFSKVRTDLHFCLRMAKKARFFLDELEQTIRAKPRLSQNDPHTLQLLREARQQICMYLDYVARFSDQIRRRIFKQELIPGHENVYSIFKPFPRWIVKGNQEFCVS